MGTWVRIQAVVIVTLVAIMGDDIECVAPNVCCSEAYNKPVHENSTKNDKLQPLPADKLKTLCSITPNVAIPFPPNLCTGPETAPDNGQLCRGVCQRLDMSQAVCCCSVPDATIPALRYFLCACVNNNNASVGDDAGWAYITAGDLVPAAHVLSLGQQCENSLKVYYLKK